MRIESEVYLKTDVFFQQFWNLFSVFCIKMENMPAYCFVAHRTAFTQYIKLHTIICHHLSQHCTAPHALVSAQRQYHSNVLLLLSTGCMLTARPGCSAEQSHCHGGHEAEGGSRTGWTRPHAACGLDMPDLSKCNVWGMMRDFAQKGSYCQSFSEGLVTFLLYEPSN